MLGEYLKNHREKLNLTINDIASMTKISPKYLLYIEENNFKNMPGELFTRSFIKEYAKSVSVNPEEALHLYEETVKPAVSTEVAPIKTEMRNKMSILYIVTSLIVLAIVIYLVYTYPSNKTVLPEKKAEVAVNVQKQETEIIKPTEPQTSETVIPQPSESVKIQQSEPVKLDKSAEKEVEKPVGKLVENPINKSAEKSAEKSKGSITPKQYVIPIVPDNKIQALAKAKPKDITNIESANKHELKIEALSDAWILIKIDNDKTYDMILKAGQTRKWSADSNFILKTGNIGGINISFDGKELGTLGKVGEVKTVTLPEKEAN